ncbi:MAG TPA: hypothetical protein VMR41_02050 [Patescibacteria group bacterium]|nr:hypothetical protein [Patescibacteria group bacterium]
MPKRDYVSHYENLKDKWTDKEQSLHKRLWQKHKEALTWFLHQSKNVTVGSAGSLLLFMGSPALQIPVTQAVQINQPSLDNNQSQANQSQFTSMDKTTFLISDLYNKLPKDVVPLTTEQEDRIAAILSVRFGIVVKAELDGKRLNRSYGLIGEEQHLARFPGDSMDTHFTSDDDAKNYWSSGMAPGLGAWGYFASSSATLTPEDILREKYYIAVPTFLSPGYDSDVAGYNAFYKYRKMLVVNPQNGKAIVADVADSGPAEWTGKHLGGSPEVMVYLNRQDGSEKGPVLYFFIDDPNDQVPLGPIDVK